MLELVSKERQNKITRKAGQQTKQKGAPAQQNTASLSEQLWLFSTRAPTAQKRKEVIKVKAVASILASETCPESCLEELPG